MNATMRKIVSAALLFVIAAAGVFYFARHRGDFHLLGSVSLSSIALIFFLQLLKSLCFGLQLKVLTDRYKLDLDFVQWFGIVRMASLTNYWLPTGVGTSTKAVYLKKVHNLPYTSFAALTGIANVIRFMVSSLFALIFLQIVVVPARAFLSVIAAFFFISTLVTLLLAHRINSDNIPFPHFLRRLFHEWRKIRGDHKAVLKLIAIHSIILILATGRIFLSFRAFSIAISPMMSGVIATSTNIIGVFKLVPGNFGIKEAIIVGISSIDGVGVNGGVHAAALDRVVGLIWTLVLTPLFLNGLFLRIKKKPAMPFGRRIEEREEGR